jgi:hypothetical protein
MIERKAFIFKSKIERKSSLMNTNNFIIGTYTPILFTSLVQINLLLEDKVALEITINKSSRYNKYKRSIKK